MPEVKIVEKCKCVAVVNNHYMEAYGNDKKEAKQVASQSLLIYLTLLENDQVLPKRAYEEYLADEGKKEETTA